MSEGTGSGRGLIYEVPEDLKYEERIFMGFTLKQVLVLAVFAGIAALVFTRYDGDIKVRLGVAGALVSGGFVLATFAPLQDEVEKRVRFLWAPKQGTWTQSDTLSRFIRVKGIEGNFVKLHDGRLLSVLIVTPVDFSVLSDAQKLALLSGYTQFLNSLSFPIQVLVRTTKLDLQAYFAGAKARAAKEGNRLALAEIESFEEFVADYLSKRAVHDRLFYIVIPHAGALNHEEAARQLEYRTGICMEKLSTAGLVNRRLGENQLVSLYASFFGGHLETNSDYLSILTLLELREEEGRKTGIAGKKPVQAMEAKNR